MHDIAMPSHIIGAVVPPVQPVDDGVADRYFTEALANPANPVVHVCPRRLFASEYEFWVLEISVKHGSHSAEVVAGTDMPKTVAVTEVESQKHPDTAVQAA